MSYLRDLLLLPEVVKKTDFVVDLTQSVGHPEALLDRYAITPGIAHAFEQAVALVKDCVDGRKNAAAYIAASFGAGKSQFMGVTSAILDGHAAPRQRPELHPLYARNDWLGEKRILRLHYNMMGARTMEDRIFRTYLAHLEKHHPGEPIPALFEDEGLFRSADAFLADLGSETFFHKLNGQQPRLAGLGELAADLAWAPESYGLARSSADPEQRARLLGALARTPWFAGRLSTERFVEFGRGLDVIARHAAGLGYHGIVLFLDELVLWFASIAGSHDHLSREVGKLSKLVEGQSDDRPIATVSFIARQRQLVDLVGERYAGEEALALRDQLQFWQGRIDEIVLEDKNLPAIIERKVVVPRDEAAKAKLGADFEKTRRRLQEAEWGTLLGELRDGSAFAKVFPFSPALIEALVALSQCLQRERTAIRMLVELLRFRLEDFVAGQLVPVGDLFDVLAAGEEPMDFSMRERFRAAKRLYQYELLPVIQQANGTADPARCQRLRDDDSAMGCANCPEKRCRADNRLVKTLLLAALVTEVPALKNMSARKLVALNHGALPSIIPGNEWSDAVARLRNLAAANGKLRVGDQADPTVSVVLEGVDLKPILDQARVHDSQGARQRKVMEIVYLAMGLAEGDAPPQALVLHEQEWRGTARKGAVYFGNVRKMPDELLLAPEGHDFRVVIDVPFDDAGFGPKDDEPRLQELLDAGKSSPTVAWFSSFLAEQVQRDLSDLVVIDQLLGPGQLKPYFENRAPEELQRAQAELTSLGEQKRQRVRRALLAAYGLKSDDGELDPASLAERRHVVLIPGAEIRGLPAADFAPGLHEAIREVLDQRWPRHAEFRERVTRGKLEKALALFERLCDAENQRLPIVSAEAKELGLAESLGIVQIGDAAAVVRKQPFQDWKRKLLEEKIEQAPTVARLRQLADAGGAAGHTPEVLDFMVRAFAVESHRDLVTADGQPIADPVLGRLPLDAKVVEVALPEETAWHVALERAGKLFGATSGRARNPANVNRLAAEAAKKRDAASLARAGEVESLLAARSSFYAGQPPRLQTARAVQELLAELQASEPAALVKALAGAKVATSLDAMLRHLTGAGAVVAALGNEMAFGSFHALRGRAEPEAGQVLEEVRKALESDELHLALGPKLEELGRRALEVIAPKLEPERQPERPMTGVIATGSARSLVELDVERGKMAKALAKSPGAALSLTWTVTKP